MNNKILNIVIICCTVLFLPAIVGIVFKFQELASYIVAAFTLLLALFSLKVKSKLPKK